MSKKEREGLAGASTGQMLKVLCPGAITAGLTDWSIRLDEKGVPIAWKCQGECYNGTKRDTQDCFPTPKCPSLSPEYLESLKGKSEEEMIRVLCPEIAQLGMEERSITLNGDGVPVAWQCKGSYQDNPLNLQCGKNTCKGSQCSLVTTLISMGLSKTSTSETMAQLCPGGTKNGLNHLTVLFNKEGYPVKWTCKGDCGNSPRKNTCSNWSMPTCPTLTNKEIDQIQRDRKDSENRNILCPNGDKIGLTEIGMKTKNDKPIEWRCKGTDPEGSGRKISCPFPASPAPTPTPTCRTCGYDNDQKWSEWGDWRQMEEEQRELKIKEYLCPGGGDITDWSVTLNAEGEPISWTCNSICDGKESTLTCKKPECECPLPTCKELTKADEEKVINVHERTKNSTSNINDFDKIKQEAESGLCQAISPAQLIKATRELTGDQEKTLESWSCTQRCTSQGKEIVTTVECPGGTIKGNEGNDCLLWTQYLLNRIQSILKELLTLEEIGGEKENISTMNDRIDSMLTIDNMSIEEVIQKIKEWSHEDLLPKLRKISPKSQDLEALIKQLEQWDKKLKE